MPEPKNPIRPLRILGLIEGTSFLLLVGVAMPLKYFANMPTAVKIFGWAHGLLVTLVCVALVRAATLARWPASRAAAVFTAALLPLGPFVIDSRMKRWEREYGANVDAPTTV
jgi:integral membrane protein